MSEPLLSVNDLKVSFPSEAGRVDAVRGVSFDLHAGRTLGIVGESGSGKSVTSLAIMGLLTENARVSGSVKLNGRELIGQSDDQLSKIRGSEIAMIFQDPLSSLTPVYTVGDQLVEALQIHQKMSKEAAWQRGIELLQLVGIPNPTTRMTAFPHEFSGGMRQRVVIAIAIANNPKLIIADEPTTALDVTIQAQVLELLKKAQEETGAAVILITHDMGVVAGAADDVIVMYAGRPVEIAPVDELYYNSKMPYTLGLLGAIPRADESSDAPLVPIEGNPPMLINLPDVCPFAPRCPAAIDQCWQGEPPLLRVDSGHAMRDAGTGHAAACWRSHEITDGQINGERVHPLPESPESVVADVPRKERPVILEVNNLVREFPLTKGALFKRRIGTVHAVNDISFDIREGETLAIVGESGCGKTTTLLAVMDLGRESQGQITVDGTDLASVKTGRDERALRRKMQVVFQDPMGALNPRLTVHEIISEPLIAFGVGKREANQRVAELMRTVGLDPAHSDRFPGAFSGGQRQRIGIARALASNPKLVMLDEPVSALDVSIQAGVINLLDELKATHALSYLFVAHDLSVVRHLADRVAVMYLGAFAEYGDVDDVFDNPQHPYTQALLSAIPIPDPKVERSRRRILLAGDLPSPTEATPGCRFASRCPLRATLSSEEQELCVVARPELKARNDRDHEYACHYR